MDGDEKKGPNDASGRLGPRYVFLSFMFFIYKLMILILFRYLLFGGTRRATVGGNEKTGPNGAFGP